MRENLQHNEADDAVDDEDDGVGGVCVLVAREDEVDDGERLADRRTAPEQELCRRVDQATVLAGGRHQDHHHGREELKDRPHDVLRVDGRGGEVTEDQLQDGEDGDGGGEGQPEDDPGGPGDLPGLAGETVVHIQGEADEEDEDGEVDQDRVLEAVRQPGPGGVPGELTVPQRCPAVLHCCPPLQSTGVLTLLTTTTTTPGSSYICYL